MFNAAITNALIQESKLAELWTVLLDIQGFHLGGTPTNQTAQKYVEPAIVDMMVTLKTLCNFNAYVMKQLLIHNSRD